MLSRLIHIEGGEAKAAENYEYCGAKTYPVFTRPERNLVFQGNIANMTVGDTAEEEYLKAVLFNG